MNWCMFRLDSVPAFDLLLDSASFCLKLVSVTLKNESH